MNISMDELRRIAEICKLSFSDEELKHLRLSIENTIVEARQLFETADSCDCSVLAHDLSFDSVLETAKQSFAYCCEESKKD